MKILIVLVAAVSMLVIGGKASAMPPCRSQCYSQGTWFWNKQSAEYQLLLSGLDIQGHHYEISNAQCYGLGDHMWGTKGPEFQRFHCSAKLFDDYTTYYKAYGLTLYVQGKYAWTWGV